MDIHPTNPSQTPKTGTNRLGKTPTSPPPRFEDKPAVRPAEEPKDNVEISAAARELQESVSADRQAGSQLPPDRLRSILKRIAEGYYDRPEVRAEVARGVKQDLGRIVAGN